MPMISSNPTNPLSGTKFSSVVPARETGNKDHELTNMDLALKLHYIKGVYFFKGEAVQGLTIYDLKKPMSRLLELFYTCSGRIRRSEATGRPFIKCNDGGVRIVEAFCDEMSIEEWLEMNNYSLDDCLAYNHVLGPDLGFSPLVFVQFTRFKCGGLSLGLSWAHILGDPFSASAFINWWGDIMSGLVPPKSLHVPSQVPSGPETSASGPGKLLPVRRVDLVGDVWQATNSRSVKTHTFVVDAKKIEEILSSNGKAAKAKASYFEVLSAVVWKSLSKVKGDSGSGVVTVCRYNNSGGRENEMPVNDLVLRMVEVGFDVAKWEVSELALLIADKRERVNCIGDEEMLLLPELRDGESTDSIMYGANLTFVDMEEAGVYGLKMQGKKPFFVNYGINGVGGEGVVLVLPGPEEEGANTASGSGRTLTVALPEDELEKLKNELKQEWDLV